MKIIRPNPGAQERFLSSNADIVIYGGARGGGKSWALLLDALRYVNNPRFTAVIFRRTYPQIAAQGGLWDKSCEIYPYFNAIANKSNYRWHFPSGASVSFAHMKDERHKLNWQGAEICYLGYDELTHFTQTQFLFLLGSNRSTCGIKPYIRATCNPDAESWVRSLVAPWLAEDGYAAPDNKGVLYCSFADGDFQILRKGKTEDNLDPKTLTYISADVWDNTKLLEINPDYITSLRSLPLIERERFLGIKGRGGNWNIKAASGLIFKSAWLTVTHTYTYQKSDRAIAYWDFAATTHTASDYSVRALLVKRNTIIYIVDILRFRAPPAECNKIVITTAQKDSQYNAAIRWQNDPGSAGVRDSAALMTLLSGYDARPVNEHRDKVSRALPLSASCEAGNVMICNGNWNQILISEMESFPDGVHDDQVDAIAGAYNCLSAIATSTGVLRY
jgi:predicted phage terminase large subunit-like protein